MNNFFSRKQQQPITIEENTIICNDTDLIRAIEKWLLSLSWDWNKFIEFLDFMGVQTPVILSNFKAAQNKFRCFSLKDEKGFDVYLKYKSASAFYYYQIWIEHQSEKLKFSIKPCPKDYKNEKVKAIWLSEKVILKDGKEVAKFEYQKKSFCCNVKFDWGASLQIGLFDFKNLVTEEDSLILRFSKLPAALEKIILSFGKSDYFPDFYSKICNCFGPENEFIRDERELEIIYSENIENENGETEERVKWKYHYLNGGLKEKALTLREPEEVFHVFSNGSWKYFGQDGKKILYDSKSKKTEVSGFTNILSEMDEEESEKYEFVRNTIGKLMGDLAK